MEGALFYSRLNIACGPALLLPMVRIRYLNEYLQSPDLPRRRVSPSSGDQWASSKLWVHVGAWYED